MVLEGLGDAPREGHELVEVVLEDLGELPDHLFARRVLLGVALDPRQVAGADAGLGRGGPEPEPPLLALAPYVLSELLAPGFVHRSLGCFGNR